MERCKICKEEKIIVKPGLRCKDCLNEYKKKWYNKKNEKTCSFCQTKYKPKSKEKECSMICKIKNNICIEEDCWIWIKKIGNSGYGEIGSDGKSKLVHRVSYGIFKGEIPKGKHVCHSCDNKKCVNPDHLWIGTQKENIQDAKNKGRLPDQRGRKHTEETLKKLKFRKRPNKRGEKHHLCKLKENDVLEIRRMLSNGLKQSEISEKYNVDQSTISSIKINRNWTHVI